MRKIYLIGTIDEAAYAKFTKKLSKYESIDSKAPVHIELNSLGGTGLDALAFYDRIKTSPCPVHITVYGCAQSAATLILAAGDFRVMGHEAWLMVHDDSGELSGNTGLLLKEAQHLEHREDQWAELLAANSETPAHVWRQLSKETTYLTAKQTYQYGLVDQIKKGKSRNV
jgi:ATP-dependent protease ClpP protease subunit